MQASETARTRPSEAISMKMLSASRIQMRRKILVDGKESFMTHSQLSSSQLSDSGSSPLTSSR